MGPCFALPLAVLACCLLPADSCILCTQEVQSALKSLERDYLPGHLDIRHHKKVMDTVNQFVKDFKDLPFNESSFMGVLDEKTMEKASWSFMKELKRITDSNVKGEQLVKQLFWMLHKEKEVFGRYTAQFQKEAFCPNQCGVMLQPLIWCEECQKEVHSCRKSRTCGVRHVKVHEKEDLVLDCLLSWHRLSEGLTDYSFFRVWKNNSETLLYKGKEPALSKPLVALEDEGKYRCVLGTVTSGPATVIEYHVTVLPPKVHEEKPGTNIITQNETTPVPVTPVDETPGDENPFGMTSAHPELFTTSLKPSQAESMLQGRLLGLLICFSIILIASLILRIIYLKKKKEKLESSGLDTDDKSSNYDNTTSKEPEKTTSKQGRK